MRKNDAECWLFWIVLVFAGVLFVPGAWERTMKASNAPTLILLFFVGVCCVGYLIQNRKQK